MLRESIKEMRAGDIRKRDKNKDQSEFRTTDSDNIRAVT